MSNKIIDLQEAFRLAYRLHPNRAVAGRVVVDGVEMIDELIKTEERRPQARKPVKIRIPENARAVIAVLAASEEWEIDQESNNPQKLPRYHPTPSDLLIRYVKALIYRTIRFPHHHTAIALASFLYTYRPAQIGRLSDELEKVNVRRIKGDIKSSLHERFPQFPISSNPELAFDMRQPTPIERELVRECLCAFAPPPSSPCDTFDADTEVYEAITDPYSEMSDLDKTHRIIHTCGGMERLIKGYNCVTISTLEDTMENINSELLDDPTGKMQVPSGITQFRHLPAWSEPEELTATEIEFMQHALSKNRKRRKRYFRNPVSVRMDGRVIIPQCFPDEELSKPYTIPLYGSFIRIIGKDSEGELSLATIPVPDLASIKDNPNVEFVTRHAGGLTIRCAIEVVEEPDGNFVGYLRIAQHAPRALFSKPSSIFRSLANIETRKRAIFRKLLGQLPRMALRQVYIDRLETILTIVLAVVGTLSVLLLMLPANDAFSRLVCILALAGCGSSLISLKQNGNRVVVTVLSVLTIVLFLLQVVGVGKVESPTLLGGRDIAPVFAAGSHKAAADNKFEAGINLMLKQIETGGPTNQIADGMPIDRDHEKENEIIESLRANQASTDSAKATWVPSVLAASAAESETDIRKLPVSRVVLKLSDVGRNIEASAPRGNLKSSLGTATIIQEQQIPQDTMVYGEYYIYGNGTISFPQLQFSLPGGRSLVLKGMIRGFLQDGQYLTIIFLPNNTDLLENR